MAKTTAAAQGASFVAMIDTTSLLSAAHTVVATATHDGQPVGTVTGSLVVAGDNLEFTTFADVGDATQSHIAVAPDGDELAFTWLSGSPTKTLSLAYLDGAFARLSPDDITLNAAADVPLSGYTAFGKDAIGVVYHTSNPADGHWLVNMRIVSLTGSELVPAMNLTAGSSAFILGQAGVDPGGFSAAWINISPSPVGGGDGGDGGAPPLEVRFARYDMAAGKLVGPVVLDTDQPAPAGSTQGTQSLETLAELGIACNTTICLVSYTRDVYNAEVLLNIPKLFIASFDIASGQPTGAPTPVEDTNWDTQEFGQNLITLDDGSFLLVYTADDTAAEVTPITPCDMELERDLLYAVKLDAKGTLMGPPVPIFDYEGSREYPRVAQHPDGYALFWEDQRSECAASGGHIAMAMNVASPALSALLDPYLEAPGSIVLPPEDPTLAVTGTNFVAGWSDNRHGSGILAPKLEIELETYWRD
jgi:hypothetical protein